MLDSSNAAKICKFSNSHTTFGSPNLYRTHLTISAPSADKEDKFDDKETVEALVAKMPR